MDKNKKYVINEEEAVAVRYIFERYAAGASYIDILKEVNARGYRTRRGAEFGKATLHDMLNNRRYIGTCILGKNQPYLDGRRNSHRPDHDGMIIVPNGCPAIISPDLFQAVHERLLRRMRCQHVRHAHPHAQEGDPRILPLLSEVQPRRREMSEPLHLRARPRKLYCRAPCRSHRQ